MNKFQFFAAGAAMIAAFAGGYGTALFGEGQFDHVLHGKDRIYTHDPRVAEGCASGHADAISVADQMSRDAIRARRAGCKTIVVHQNKTASMGWYNPVTKSHNISGILLSSTFPGYAGLR